MASIKVCMKFNDSMHDFVKDTHEINNSMHDFVKG